MRFSPKMLCRKNTSWMKLLLSSMCAAIVTFMVYSKSSTSNIQLLSKHFALGISAPDKKLTAKFFIEEVDFLYDENKVISEKQEQVADEDHVHDEDPLPEEKSKFPPTDADPNHRMFSLMHNCSVRSLPRQWLNNNLTLRQLGHTLEMKDCTLGQNYELQGSNKSEDIELLFSTRQQLISKGCESLGSSNNDLHADWTWQSTTINGSMYLDDNTNKNYRICMVPKAGSTSWGRNSRITSNDQPLQTNHQVNILPVRHPFARLVSVYIDKFCLGKIFTCQSANIFDRMLYGMWIPILISSGRLEINKAFAKALKKVKRQKGEGHMQIVNMELARAVNKSYSSDKQDILDTFKGTVITFKDFIYHVFWSYEHGVADHHWNPQTSLCDVCKVPWSYVLHLENHNEEAEYMLKKLGFKTNGWNELARLNIKGSEGAAEYINYFYEIPTNMIVKLVSYYYYDFILLDYSL